MLLKGIDAQLMVTRASDYAKDADVMRRGNEMQQAQLAEQNKIRDVRNQQSVAKSPNSEKTELHTGEEADGTGDQHFSRRRKEEQPEEREEPVSIIDTKNHKLDVSI